MNNRFEEEKNQELKASAKENIEKKETTQAASKEWEDDEIKLLVKALKVIAVGTRDR